MQLLHVLFHQQWLRVKQNSEIITKLFENNFISDVTMPQDKWDGVEWRLSH